jgi:exopolysaccharide biosynthesis protein
MMAAAGVCVVHKARPHKHVDPNIKVVEIKLGPGIEIRPALAADDSGLGESFTSMVARLHPYAAINGTYYDSSLKPLGDVLVNGKLVNRGGQRHAIAVTKSGKVAFIRKRHGRFNWKGYKYGLAAGPRLVHQGKVALDPVADGFSRRSLTLTAWRCAVGTTSKGTLLLVTAKKELTLAEFAKLMQGLGATEAMNLDGGGACGLYHEGKTLATPALSMSNILAVYKK